MENKYFEGYYLVISALPFFSNSELDEKISHSVHNSCSVEIPLYYSAENDFSAEFLTSEYVKKKTLKNNIADLELLQRQTDLCVA